MADIKWIKISTEIFNDDAFQIIDGLPEADAIELIWFKLLVLAGKQNNNGLFLFKDTLPYTDELLASIFHRPLNIVRLAMETFTRLKMIEVIDDVYAIPNWDKYQSLDAYEKKKERDRIYQQERREKQKKLIEDKKSSDNRLTVGRDCSYSYSNNNNINNYIYILKNNSNEYIDYINNNSLLNETIEDWMKYKDERKPKANNHYTETSLNGLIKKIVKACYEYDADAVDRVIQDSISNNYQGIVWDKLTKKKGNTNGSRVVRHTQSDEELRAEYERIANAEDEKLF